MGMVGSLVTLLVVASSPQGTLPPGGVSAISPDALTRTLVGGLERTQSRANVLDLRGPTFVQGLQVRIGGVSDESNATQLTLPNATAIRRGDVLFATFWLRGRSADGRAPAKIQFLFERATNPWTKSITFDASAARNGSDWRQIFIPFQSAEAYAPGEAMFSFRFAFGPQRVEMGDLHVVNYGTSHTVDELTEMAILASPLGKVTAKIDGAHPGQAMRGLGGNFCQARYGYTTALDNVGRYTLANLKVAHARVGLPLNYWTPTPDTYVDDAQAKASLLALQALAARKIPTVVSVWEGPTWMLGGQPEATGRPLPPNMYDPCIRAIVRYLTLARDKYKAEPAYLSFNEPDYGVNFKFTSLEMANFIRQAGPAMAAAGLRTKFLIGDTANGTNAADYIEPLLKDTGLAAYLGPIAFHGWDALGATDLAYQRIRELGQRYRKEVWCTEAGHDAQLWQANDPWRSWENALRTALAYERTIRVSGAQLMDYWTYQDNYPLVDEKTSTPFPVFQVMRQLEGVFGAGQRILPVTHDSDSAQLLASQDRKGHRTVLVVNPSGAGQTFLSGFRPNAKLRVLTSDRSAQRQETLARTDRSGGVTLRIPARSVVTVSELAL